MLLPLILGKLIDAVTGTAEDRGSEIKDGTNNNIDEELHSKLSK